MNTETIYQVLKKLIGPIDPVGETNTDNNRLENLKIAGELVSKLLYDIDSVEYKNKEAHEYSRKKASDYAKKLMDSYGITE